MRGKAKAFEAGEREQRRVGLAFGELVSRVSTLPRKSMTRRSGRSRFTCAWRRNDEVPTTAPGGSAASEAPRR